MPVVMFEALRDVRPAPFPLTFEKVTAPVTFRVVMLAVVAARVETFSVVRFAAPKRFEALRDVRPAPFPLTFEKVTAPVTFRVVMLAVVAARVETFSVVRFAAPKSYVGLSEF